MRNVSTQFYDGPHGQRTRVIDMRSRQRPRMRRWDGTAWVAGIEFTGLNTDPAKPYVWCDRATPTAYESAEGYTVIGGRRTCPSHVEIFEKHKLVEPPHVPGM